MDLFHRFGSGETQAESKQTNEQPAPVTSSPEPGLEAPLPDRPGAQIPAPPATPAAAGPAPAPAQPPAPAPAPQPSPAPATDVNIVRPPPEPPSAAEQALRAITGDPVPPFTADPGWAWRKAPSSGSIGVIGPNGRIIHVFEQGDWFQTRLFELGDGKSYPLIRVYDSSNRFIAEGAQVDGPFTATLPQPPSQPLPRGQKGWRPDPHGEKTWRYHDGTRWTDYTAD
jgi:hypothetical protein